MFEKKTGTYVKDGAEKSYEKTTCIDKIDKTCAAYFMGADYLRHQQHVDNISVILPNNKETHIRKYIQIDFSKNIFLKTKQVVQETHFQENSTTCTAPLINMKIISLSTISVMIQHMIQAFLSSLKGYFQSLEDF